MELHPRFVARGNAVAFAGRITRVGDRPVDQLIDLEGNSTSLPVTGGLSRSETGRVALLHDHTWPAPLVSFASGSTRAWDETRGDVRVTHVMATTEGFSIAGRFFVDRASAYLRSSYRKGADEPEIIVGESSVIGMRCEGHDVEVRWNTELINKAPTFAALEKAWARSKGTGFDRQVLKVRASRRQEPKTLPTMKGYLPVVVAELAWAGAPHPDVTLDGHVLRWSGFGTVYVGEMLIANYLRRLTVLRFDLGSPFAMDGSAIEVESNGVGLP